MRRTDLHHTVQASCIAIPGHSGCYAVVPPPGPVSVTLPEAYPLFVLARREIEALTSIIKRNTVFSDLVFRLLNRRDAVDSSQIEGLQTQLDGLLIHEIETGTIDAGQASDADKTFSCVRAFAAGSHEVDLHGQAALTQDLIKSLHRELIRGQERAEPGQWRTVQNYIGTRLETAHYVPPPATEVPRLMQDLEKLLQYRPDGMVEVSILMRAGIAHAQFEAIHPFRDGNGRVGRLLLPLMFKAAGAPPIHLSTFLKIRQREYYAALLEMQTRMNWAPWMRLFLECMIASCRHTVELFVDLETIKGRWRQVIAGTGRRRNATIWQVADLLIGQPVVTANMVAGRLGVTFPAANDAIASLVDLGVLHPANGQRRHRVFHAHDVMNALYRGVDAALDDVARLTGLE